MATGEQVTIEIVESVLDALKIIVRQNLLNNEIEIEGLPASFSKGNAANTLPVYLQNELKSLDVKGITTERITGILNLLADKNRYNPIEIFLNSGKWDAIDRLPKLFDILGVSEDKYKNYIVKWLEQCVALGLNDEEKPVSAEGVLVLQGPQGLAKTAFFRVMALNPHWFIEGASIDVANKDSILNAIAGWICELGELDSTLKREQSALKAYITMPYDKIRRPYARTATRSPRRTSFCGTVNPDNYLRDETGSRRFWTVPVTQIDKNTLFSLSEDWVSQLWYQVYEIYQQNKNGFRLTDSEMKVLQADNMRFETLMPYETEVRELLDFNLPAPKWGWWTASEIVAILPGYPPANQIGKVLTKVITEELACGQWGTNINPATYAGPGPQVKKSHKTNVYYLPLRH